MVGALQTMRRSASHHMTYIHEWPLSQETRDPVVTGSIPALCPPLRAYNHPSKRGHNALSQPLLIHRHILFQPSPRASTRRSTRCCNPLTWTSDLKLCWPIECVPIFILQIKQIEGEILSSCGSVTCHDLAFLEPFVWTIRTAHCSSNTSPGY